MAGTSQVTGGSEGKKIMRRKANQRILHTLTSLLLSFCLLTGVCAPAALAEDAPDRNVLAYALSVARQAEEDGAVDALVPSVRAEFRAALEAAQSVYENPDATREEIQAGYEALQAVIWRLSYAQADKTALRAAIARAEATDLTGSGMTKILAVANALAAAKELEADEELNASDQAAVDAAAAALTSALTASEFTGGGSTKPAAPKEPEKPAENLPVAERFPDIKADAWYAADVQYVVDSGLMQGNGNGFQPEANTSRAMLLTVLYRMAGSPDQAEAGDTWYSEPLAWAKSAGLTDGSSPEDNITREQIAVLLFRYARAGAGKADLSGFPDAQGVSGWAREAVAWAVEQGLLNGKSGGLLDPQGAATRAEVAALLARFSKLEQKG